MSPAYTALIHELNHQALVAPDEVYMTDAVPRLTDVYELFYEFANTHLQGRRQALGFPPSYLFFRNDFSVNAFARTRAAYKMIGINYGCFEQMFGLYEDNEAKFGGQEYESLHQVCVKIGNPLHICLFQFFSMFVYYHEYAHLVQRSPLSTFQIDESLSGNVPAPDVLRSHAYELDADWYASSNAGQHMTQFFEDVNHEFTGTEQEVSDMASLGLTAILCYFIKSGGAFPQMYLAERTHPHAFVRLCYCTIFLLNTLAPNLPPNFVINQADILNKSISMAELILAGPPGNPVAGFAGIFMQHQQAMENHINDIIDYAVGDPFLCRNRPMGQI